MIVVVNQIHGYEMQKMQIVMVMVKKKQEMMKKK
jgi:hypothetical protein